ncbi:hypothetical protein COOONC_13958 [Cooperia oncophora]
MARPLCTSAIRLHGDQSIDLEAAKKSPYKWSEEWLDSVPLDHFSFGNKGPVQAAGFMWDIAPEFHAAVVFAEHRFYGKTQPYGTTSYNTTDHLGYLSSEQALADFVLLIDYLRQERIPGAENSPVIAFGGSYGGMLAAWIRIKYPHKVAGAIAASAPVFWFVDSHVPEDIYAKVLIICLLLFRSFILQ